jgi:hypothetical protein
LNALWIFREAIAHADETSKAVWRYRPQFKNEDKAKSFAAIKQVAMDSGPGPMEH